MSDPAKRPNDPMSNTPLILPALGPIYQTLGPWVEALLRFMVGMAMVPHGMRMCLGYFKGTGIPVSNVQMVADLFNRKGYRPGKLWAYGVVLTMFVAAPLFAFGLFTRPLAVPIFVLLALSAYDHGRYDGYFWNRSGIEYPAMWAAGALYFLINGGGTVSLDHWLIGFEF
jgi:putative oxidoreductase